MLSPSAIALTLAFNMFLKKKTEIKTVYYDNTVIIK